MFKQASWIQSGGILLICSSLWVQPSYAVQPRIVEVPTGPAFVRLPGSTETEARSGQALKTNSILKTSKSGRMQVLLDNGRQFRMGGDAQLRLGSTNVELLKGSIIGWIQPGALRIKPFTIKTRLATASIQGTTVFIEYTDDKFKILSWEGTVKCETRTGQRYTLTSGQRLSLDLRDQTDEVRAYLDELDSNVSERKDVLSGPEISDQLFPDGGPQELSEVKMNLNYHKPIAADEAEKRLEVSPLINGFSKPIETISDIKRELGLTAQSQKSFVEKSSLENLEWDEY